jgi:hypothetical protein
MRASNEMDKINSVTRPELCVTLLLSLRCQKTCNPNNLSLTEPKRI